MTTIRLIGDVRLPPERRLTKTKVQKFYHSATAGGEHKLLRSGLLHPVTIQARE
jgi:hypothetical protein